MHAHSDINQARRLEAEQSEPDPAVDQLFAQRPVPRRLFERVNAFIRSLGDVIVVPRKTQVGYKRVRGFAWVWLPQTWIRKQPADSITLTFSLDHPLKSRRIKALVEPYPGRFTHHVVISKASEFDAAVKRWLRQAYDLAGQERGRKGKAKSPVR